MPSLTIKNIPKAVLDRLRRCAHVERRSLTQQALLLIERGLSGAPSRSRAESVREQVEAWRRIAGRWVSDRSADDEIREIRRSRTKGRKVDM